MNGLVSVMREYKVIKEFRNTDDYKQYKEENKDYIIDKIRRASCRERVYVLV